MGFNYFPRAISSYGNDSALLSIFENKMSVKTVVIVSSLLNMIIGVGQVAITCSIFDFVVMNRQFYSMPNRTILIESKWTYFSNLFASLNMLVCMWSLHRVYDNVSKGYEQIGKWARMKHTLLSLLHLLFLIAFTAAALYLCINFSLMAQTVGMFTENSEPIQFQDAANWYYKRLYALAALYGCSTILSLISFCAQNNCSEKPRKETSSKSRDYPKTQC
ncbi:hypothetical protein QR680_006004 [Steinernema hermaphroditum]|uniref:Uncharacterized protein n=1 Tax=Steinernema hermaphroditum TaxID=289476 RepID=A0AA39HW99_9BILA|nr:hypothetical protein QR680_006004 [Steinernema hermaphroditum]